MPRLVLLNGPPGVGKSTLGRRFADTRPLTLLLDVDLVRSLLAPDGPDVTASWLAARALALAMADTHLRAGHDVVVPQYLGRVAFIDRLSAVAARTGSEFVEVVLRIGATAGHARFAARGDVPQLAGATESYAEMHARLEALLATRPGVLEVDAGGDLTATLRALRDVLER